MIYHFGFTICFKFMINFTTVLNFSEVWKMDLLD